MGSPRCQMAGTQSPNAQLAGSPVSCVRWNWAVAIPPRSPCPPSHPERGLRSTGSICSSFLLPTCVHHTPVVSALAGAPEAPHPQRICASARKWRAPGRAPGWGPRWARGAAGPRSENVRWMRATAGRRACSACVLPCGAGGRGPAAKGGLARPARWCRAIRRNDGVASAGPCPQQLGEGYVHWLLKGSYLGRT